MNDNKLTLKDRLTIAANPACWEAHARIEELEAEVMASATMMEIVKARHDTATAKVVGLRKGLDMLRETAASGVDHIGTGWLLTQTIHILKENNDE